MNRLMPAEDLLKDLGVAAAGEIDVNAIAYYAGAMINYRPPDVCEVVMRAWHAGCEGDRPKSGIRPS